MRVQSPDQGHRVQPERCITAREAHPRRGVTLALDPRAARWFTDRRGIRPETVEAFGIYTDGRDLVFPYPEGLLKRRYSIDEDNPFGLEKDGRRFVWKDKDGGPVGAGQVPYLPPDFEPGKDMLLFEGETDTMAAWQAATDVWKPRIVGLSGINSWKTEYAEKLFGDARRVFVVVDNDDPYENPDATKSVEKGWQSVKADLGKKARRVQLPQGINDAAEFFMQYDWAAFHVLLKRASEPKRYYRRLDLNQPVPDTDWLVEDLLVRSEATVLAGDGGVGKSFITMALALAISAGEPCFLGMPIPNFMQRPVLYVDEENSAGLVLQRLHALGYDPKKHASLEYLWYAGVDLLGEPEKLLEEAHELEPALVVIDSLSRVALGAEENSNPDMTKLMRAGVIPIARETGAAVLLVHHTSATGTAPRGATSIRNSSDQTISIVAAENAAKVKTGKLNIFPSKPRRQTAHLQAHIVGDMEKDGWVRVERAEEEDPF